MVYLKEINGMDKQQKDNGDQEGNGERGVLAQYLILSRIIRSLRKYLSKDLKEGDTLQISGGRAFQAERWAIPKL